MLTGGADTEEGADPPAELAGDPPFPGVLPDEPGFVVVPGLVVVVSDVVVVSLVVVVSVVGVVSVVVVVSQWSSLPLARCYSRSGEMARCRCTSIRATPYSWR